MKANQKQDRFTWAIDCMNIRKGAHVAEIGCGDGKALQIICEKVDSVWLFAIDRSAVAISKTKKNLKSLQQVKIKKSELSAGVFEKKKFDFIFCFNVNFFWTNSESEDDEYEEILRSLKPSGKFFLFYQTPNRKVDPQIIQKLKQNLKSNGFQYLKEFKDPQTGSFGVQFRK